jgi:hypothetical protein
VSTASAKELKIRLPICTARWLDAVEHPSAAASQRQTFKLVKVAKMTRLSREQLFTPDEIAIVHVMNRAVRRCFLMGYDQFTGRNYDYRKDWIEHRIEHLAKYFSIDVLAYSILSNHMHLVLRQRPDIVRTWDDTEVARRWLMLCPKKKNKDGSPTEPTEPQLNSIRNNASKLKQIRSRLSDISWWMPEFQ